MPTSTTSTLSFQRPGRSRYIHLVGIELEGGWKASRGIRPYGDGSVRNVIVPRDSSRPEIVWPIEPTDLPCTGGVGGNQPCASCVRQRDLYLRTATARRRETYAELDASDNAYVGEISSPPLKQSEAIDWLLHNYPDGANESCGMHVHTSFRSKLRYAQLMDEDFRAYYRMNMGEWAEEHIPRNDLFWERWRGHNRYCMDNWTPDTQVTHTGKGGDRYTFLNFAYNCHDNDRTGVRERGPRKTMEARVFPVFSKKETAAAVVCHHLKVIEDFLSTRPRREAERAKEVVVLPPEPEEVIEMERILCV